MDKGGWSGAGASVVSKSVKQKSGKKGREESLIIGRPSSAIG